jgi:type IV secretory pathway protease TraF
MCTQASVFVERFNYKRLESRAAFIIAIAPCVVGRPLPRLQLSRDISPAAVFLASDAAASGAESEMTGGDSAKNI